MFNYNTNIDTNSNFYLNLNFNFKNYWIRIWLCNLLAIFAPLLHVGLHIGHAHAEVQVPPMSGPVTDLAQMIPDSQEQQIVQLLQEFRQKGGSQISILTVPDLGGDTIEQASIKVADAWKLGGEKKDDGIILLVAKEERAVRIEVGMGLEGVLTDAHSKRIIDETIIPLFKEGDFTSGIFLGVVEIAKNVNPDIPFWNPEMQKDLASNKAGGRHRKRMNLPFYFIFIIMFILLNMRNSRSRSWGYHGGGGGGWGGGGGGGWSGGGGGFSGGGASGKW